MYYYGLAVHVQSKYVCAFSVTLKYCMVLSGIQRLI